MLSVFEKEADMDLGLAQVLIASGPHASLGEVRISVIVITRFGAS